MPGRGPKAGTEAGKVGTGAAEGQPNPRHLGPGQRGALQVTGSHGEKVPGIVRPTRVSPSTGTQRHPSVY